MKQYIKGAGGTVVSKSILEGASRLKWFFRQEAGHGNGWIAFGDRDTQEYVDNPDNMAVVDFNVLPVPPDSRISFGFPAAVPTPLSAADSEPP